MPSIGAVTSSASTAFCATWTAVSAWIRWAAVSEAIAALRLPMPGLISAIDGGPGGGQLVLPLGQGDLGQRGRLEPRVGNAGGGLAGTGECGLGGGVGLALGAAGQQRRAARRGRVDLGQRRTGLGQLGLGLRRGDLEQQRAGGDPLPVPDEDRLDGAGGRRRDRRGRRACTVAGASTTSLTVDRPTAATWMPAELPVHPLSSTALTATAAVAPLRGSLTGPHPRCAFGTPAR